VIAALAPPAAIGIAKCPVDTDNPCVKRPVGDPRDQQKLNVHRGANDELIEAGTANFRVTVTNTGQVTLKNVKVTDALSPNCNRNLGTMAIGASKTYTCTRSNVTAAFLNTAKVVGTPVSGGANVRDQDVSSVITSLFTG